MMFPESQSTFLTVIDLQERLCGAIAGSREILPRVKVLIEGAKALNIPIIVTEQYPQGLGPTLPELKEILPPDVPFVVKTAFSCFGAEEYCREAEKTPRGSLVIAGVESHVCVLQTALDGLARGYEVYVPEDCVASRRDSDKASALALLRASGVHVVTSEMLLFLLLRDSRHPAFKTISKIIR
jgi:nicotinamidase-related amidase